MNILLVDDDKDSRGSVGEFLRELGHHVVECNNGCDALKVFQTKDFQIVLSDIKLPKISGLELLREILALPHGEDVYFIFFTGYGDMESANETLRAGAYHYLLKPINIKELVELIERIEIEPARTKLILNDKLNGVNDEKCQLEELTEQENKVLDGLAQGKTNKEMAEELYLSPATIHNYLSNILRKYNLSNRVAATVYALKKMKDK